VISIVKRIKFDNELHPKKAFCPYCKQRVSRKKTWLMDKRRVDFVKEEKIAKGLSDITYRCKNCGNKFILRA